MYLINSFCFFSIFSSFTFYFTTCFSFCLVCNLKREQPNFKQRKQRNTKMIRPKITMTPMITGKSYFQKHVDRSVHLSLMQHRFAHC